MAALFLLPFDHQRNDLEGLEAKADLTVHDGQFFLDILQDVAAIDLLCTLGQGDGGVGAVAFSLVQAHDEGIVAVSSRLDGFADDVIGIDCKEAVGNVACATRRKGRDVEKVRLADDVVGGKRLGVGVQRIGHFMQTLVARDVGMGAAAVQGQAEIALVGGDTVFTIVEDGNAEARFGKVGPFMVADLEFCHLQVLSAPRR